MWHREFYLLIGGSRLSGLSLALRHPCSTSVASSLRIHEPPFDYVNMLHYTNEPEPNTKGLIKPSELLQTSGENLELLEEARTVIQDDASVYPEDKKHLATFLTIAPDPTYTAQRIVELARSHHTLGELVIWVKSGCKFLGDGGAGRPSASREHVMASSSNDGQQSMASHKSGENQPTALNPEPSMSSVKPGSSQQKKLSSSARSSTWTAKLRMRTPCPRCEVTNQAVSDPSVRSIRLKACHIMPVGCTGNEKSIYLWKIMSCFWPDHIVNRVKTFCTEKDINRFTNGILMLGTVHDHFDNLDFYLIPDWESEMTEWQYTATFFWRERRAGIANYWFVAAVVDGEPTYREMKNGDKTTDPEKFPLPDPGLLHIRHIITLAAYPKANGVKIETAHDSDEDDDVDLYSISDNGSAVTSWSSVSPRMEDNAQLTDDDKHAVQTETDVLSVENEDAIWINQWRMRSAVNYNMVTL